MTTLADLPTPVLILDRSRLLANVARMQAQAKNSASAYART